MCNEVPLTATSTELLPSSMIPACVTTCRSASPESSIDRRNRKRSRHNWFSPADIAIRSRRIASMKLPSSCSRVCNTNKYDAAVLSRPVARHVWNVDEIKIGWAHGSPYLEKALWASNDVEQQGPTCDLDLARTSHNHIQRGVEVVEELHGARQNTIFFASIIAICPFKALRRVILFDNAMQKDLQSVCEEN